MGVSPRRANCFSLPKSTLSHRVKELETSLGVRLINRTSRQFAVTEVGEEFYQYAVALLRSAEDAEEAMRQRLAEPSGVIRVTVAAEIAQFALRHVLPTFLSNHPKVRIIETATDRMVDILGEGFDLAIRGHTGQLQDSNLVQHPLAKAQWYLFAGPEYLERMPQPEQPEELASHSSDASIDVPDATSCFAQQVFCTSALAHTMRAEHSEYDFVHPPHRVADDLHDSGFMAQFDAWSARGSDVARRLRAHRWHLGPHGRACAAGRLCVSAAPSRRREAVEGSRHEGVKELTVL